MPLFAVISVTVRTTTTLAMAHIHSFHSVGAKKIRQLFLVGIILNLLFVILEFVMGFYSNSLSLLSDAGHNLSDVATLCLSLFAFQITKRKATEKFTYGYDKSTIIASLANAVILLIALGSIGWEALERFIDPRPVEGKIISLVAATGIIINGLCAFTFFKSKEHDLNVKGAYLHLLADTLVSVGVVIAGVLIMYTGKLWIDPLMSLVVMAVVLKGSWTLLRESLNLSLDAVPSSINPEEIKAAIMTHPGVLDVYHIHIWAMSTTKNALTAHLKVDENLSLVGVSAIKEKLRLVLADLKIEHVTLETDPVSV